LLGGVDDNQQAQHEGSKDHDKGPLQGGEIYLADHFPEEQAQAGGIGEGSQEEEVEQGADVKETGNLGADLLPESPQEPTQGP
jgi:hypothetical protein